MWPSASRALPTGEAFQGLPRSTSFTRPVPPVRPRGALIPGRAAFGAPLPPPRPEERRRFVDAPQVRPKFVVTGSLRPTRGGRRCEAPTTRRGPQDPARVGRRDLLRPSGGAASILAIRRGGRVLSSSELSGEGIGLVSPVWGMREVRSEDKRPSASRQGEGSGIVTPRSPLVRIAAER